MSPHAQPKDHHLENAKALARLPHHERASHEGEFAVLVGGKIVSFHATNSEALGEAWRTYGAGAFSVTRVEGCPAEMGFADCADYPRQA